MSTSGATKLSTTRLLWIIAVVPISAATFALASGNLLAFRTLEALEALSTLRIRVALTPASLQILGLTVVRAAQLLDAAVQRIVAVVPIASAAFALASGNLLALGALEALQALRALRVRVALASAALQILGTAAVSAAQVLDAAVQRIVAVVPIFAAAIALASGNLLALGALEALEALRALRILVAFASARLQVLCTTAVSATQRLVARWLSGSAFRANLMPTCSSQE